MGGVSAIVPAAGLSRRMAGANKLLQPWGEGTVIGTVVGTLAGCGLDVVVVTGHQADLVRRAAGLARFVHNPSYANGLGGSIAMGVSACQDAQGFLIALGDMPELDPALVARLLQNAAPDAIVAPVYEAEPDRPGHPVLFGSRYRDELLQLTGDQGARSLLNKHRDRLVVVPAPHSLRDLDRSEDFHAG